MLRMFVAIFFATTIVCALDFVSLKELALQKSPYLRSNALLIDQAKLEGAKTMRYQNPSLELEYSKFDQESGYRLNLSQPLRLWGVGDAQEALARAIQNNAKQTFTLSRSRFILRLGELYLSFKQAMQLEELAKQEEAIAKRVYAIAKERFENGTIAKADMLQAKLAYNLAKAKTNEASLKRLSSYYDLLSFSGIEEELPIESDFVFSLMQNATQNNPTLGFLQAQKERFAANEKLYSNKIEWVNLFAEYEAESDVDIYRVGLNIPLAVFNTRSQEKQQARLQTKASELLMQNYKNALAFSLQKIARSLQKIKNLIASYEATLQDQQELLALFEEGYKIASIDIVQIEQVKNALIETKRRLIVARIQKEQSINRQNYLQGNYNE